MKPPRAVKPLTRRGTQRLPCVHPKKLTGPACTEALNGAEEAGS
ncbi:MAG: hypothetical protein Q8K67_00420 [Geothrix sp.]|nr:hypothetical protein [Geothrix sp.]